jgi:anti-sigma regulatory factor (Ser/Thr protein kinase)
LLAECFGNPLHVNETSTFSCTMPDRLDALAEMRAELRAWLARSDVDPETAEDIVLAAWEVCANAAEHPVDPKHHDVTLVATVGPSGVCIVVEDTGSWRDSVSRPGRGLGLRLARAMVDRMSIVTRAPGTEVVLWRSTGGHA